ncbi:hypothetical protein HK097_000884 [Rhizophlyctis rosea]|uniref:AB hydrolase-1 domain-containing protein n=1 Tax=Rhizophlyctis rosea TaxID=64517 RepID=A0AAD5SD52_9FUNG|nr:hypothetical protein HK097_000884 [Rhizophlyctis rosea]
MSPLQNIFPNPTKFYIPPNTPHRIPYEDSLPTSPTSSPSGVALFLPGMGDFRHSFRFIAPKFASELDYRCLVADMRGAGPEAQDPKGGNYGFFECVSDALGILDQEGVKEPVTFVVNSFCAAVALHIAIEHPARVKAIVGLAGFFRPASGIFASVMPIILPLVVNSYTHTIWLTYYKKLFISHPPADLPSYISAMDKIYSSDPNKSRVLNALLKSAPQCGPTWAKVAECKAPVLVVVGEKDPDWPDAVKEGKEVFGKLTGSVGKEIVVFEGVGHYPHVELPERTFEVAKAFLERVDRGGVVEEKEP